MNTSEEQREAYCSRYCTNAYGWNATRRAACREKTACNEYDAWVAGENKDQYIAELEGVVKAFVAHYPSGINPYLDEAYGWARAILAKP